MDVDKTIQVNDLCQKCKGKCCVGEIEVFPSDEIYSNTILTTEVEDNEYYNRAMKVDSKNNCLALVNGLCTIYEKRPMVCRNFTANSPCCLKFFHGEKTKHSCRKCNLY